MSTTKYTSESLKKLSRSNLINLSLKLGVTRRSASEDASLPFAYTAKSAALIDLILAKQCPAARGERFEVPTNGIACTEIPDIPDEVKAALAAPAVAVEVVDAPPPAPVAETPAPEAIDANVIPFTPESSQADLPASEPEEPAAPESRTFGFFKINRKTFSRQVAGACKVVSNKSTMPVLACVLLAAKDGHVQVIGTNLDVTVATKAIAKVEGSFALAINARLLNDFIRKCDSEFLMVEELTSNRIRISDIANKTEMSGIGHEEFVPAPELGTLPGFKVPSRQFKQVIGETIAAASTDETRYILNGLGIDVKAGTVVATDGRRLMHAPLGATETAADTAAGVRILPTFAAQVIASTIPEGVDAAVTFSENRRMSVVADAEGFAYRLTCKLVDGNYPNYSQVIPKGDNRGVSFVAEAKALRPIIARLMVLTTEKSNSIKLEFTTGNLKMRSASPEHGHGDEPTPVDGSTENPVNIGLNPMYLDDVLSSWGDEKVTINVKDEVSPMVVTAGAKLAVLMPVRLS